LLRFTAAALLNNLVAAGLEACCRGANRSKSPYDIERDEERERERERQRFAQLFELSAPLGF